MKKPRICARRDFPRSGSGSSGWKIPRVSAVFFAAMLPLLRTVLQTLLLLVSLGSLRAAESIVYKTVDGRELKLMVEKPPGWKATDQRPAIVFYFGGGWVSGSAEQFRPQSEYFASRGMVGIRVEYRTIPKGDKGPPVVSCADAKSAMRHVRGHAAELGIDPGRIAAAGGSAGGHLAAFTALVAGGDDPVDDMKISCKPNALILFNPVFNNGPGQWGYGRVGEKYRQFSPAHNIAKGAPPAVVFLGENDNLIPVEVAREFQTRMKAVGSRCDLHLYPGAGHGFFNKDPWYTKTLEQADKFLVSLHWIDGPAVAKPEKPNIVFILCDDLGYGDVKCLNPQGRIPTPNMDRVAAGGMKFTDAHSSSAVCTPTRYGVLTGRYNWRSRLKSGVLFGFSPRLIEPGRTTVAAFLKDHGYATACIGKWHLGLNWPRNDIRPAGADENPKKVDFTKPIEGGPTTLGFDWFYGISASLDMPPFVFIENDRVTEQPTVEKTWVRKGPAAKSFEAAGVLPTITEKAVNYLKERASEANKAQPFFFYLPLSSPHTPILPTKEWQGKSGLNAYADFVMQTDATVGAVLDSLEKLGLAENTLLVLTSDNGCSPQANFAELRAKGHDPSGPLRGMKADIFDGGHRIPFLVRWPGHVKPGTSSEQLVCLTDFFATCAGILHEKLPDTMAEDSVSILPALLGAARQPIHEAVIHHSINGSFAVRQGPWKLELCPGSGGWSDPKPGSPQAAGLPPVQLYNVSNDIAETRNVQAEHPEIVAKLTHILEKYVADGRSTPGAPQPNTGAIHIRGKGELR